MTHPVDVPFWLLALLVAFAAVTFASHFLFPSVRWFLRRRAERLVGRLNERLARPIQPFKLARRTDTVARLVHDPEVARAIAVHARMEGEPEDVAFETAQRYAREIVPSFSAILYFGVATRLARRLSNGLYRVHVTGRGARLEGVDPAATVIFVMNHRSNMDYVLVTWLLAGDTSLAYAVGEWARRWPLRPMIRAMGGFFVRRRDLNPLYRKVLARYVQIATAAGVTQAVFPEGRLTRDGALQPPKLGILSYVLEGHRPEDDPDVVFVPVALGYERVLEDRRLVAAAADDAPGRFRLTAPQVARYVAKHLRLRLRGRFDGFGRAAVSFGEPLSLREFRRWGDDDPAAALGGILMDRIARVMPVLPLPAVAEALLAGAGTPAAVARRLAGRAPDLRRTLARGGAPGPDDLDLDRLVAEALDVLAIRGLVARAGDAVAPRPEGEAILRYYARALPPAPEAAARTISA